MKYFFIIFFLTIIGIISVAGLRGGKSSRPPIEIFPDMDRQMKIKPQTESDFYEDGRSAREPVAGTVARGHYVEDEYLATGRIKDRWGTGLPFKITWDQMKRGRERFNISCAVCHGATGSGNGIVSEYGFAGIANLNTDRIRQMADGEIYNTITHGKGNMNGYGSTISQEDRWLIIAYIRALQYSQNAPVSDIPKDELKNLE